MLQVMDISQGRLVSDGQADGDVLVFCGPDEKERELLCQKYHLDEHTLASALDPDEQARLEFEPNHVAIILKRPKNYSHDEMFVFRITSVGLFLFSDKLIIVQSEPAPIFEGRGFNKLSNLGELVLKIMNTTISHFIGHLKVINAVSESLEHQINTSMQNKFLFDMFSLEKSLVYYLNAISSNSKLIERLRINSSKIGFSPDLLEQIDDILIENSQCFEQAKIYSDILASMMDARVSIVSNNLNWLMKTLTIITIAIMLPTFVVSLFSMNVPIPGQQRTWMFWFILALASTTILGLRFVWRWKKW